jgi:hypothetical protein
MTVRDHLQQARRNEDLARKLGSKPLEAYDWAITVMFYSLLHFVDAFLLQHHNVIPKGHTATRDRKTGQRIPGRNDYVRQYLPQIYDAYKTLYDVSILARYEGVYLTRSSVVDYKSLKNNEFASARGFFRQRGW